MPGRPISLERTMRFPEYDPIVREHDTGIPKLRPESFPLPTACGIIQKRDFTVITSTCRVMVFVEKTVARNNVAVSEYKE